MSLLKLPGTVTAVGWEPPNDLGVEKWLSIMEQLKGAEKSMLWIIGDGLKWGAEQYGEMYAQALDATDMSYQTLANTKSVAEKFESSRRRENLSFKHHAEVAALPEEKQDELLREAEDEGWSAQELRRAVKRAQTPTKAPESPPGKYRVVYADPPWKYNDKLIEGYGAAEHHYKTLTVEEICAWPVIDKLEDDAVLFLWVTSPLLFESKAVIDAWGFEYKSSFIWDKIKHNMGHYNSVRHEFLLICTRGSCTPEVATLIDSVVDIERGEHSEKPERFREIIDTLYPNGAHLEIFARRQVAHWTPWGDQVKEVA